MKSFVGLLVLALASAANSGNVAVRMPFGSPAGVTYVDSTYHAGLSAGPIAYSAPASTLSFSAAPVAAAAYSAIPTVQQVPGVADIPVTSYEAQPGVIQKVVDVAKPAVQTRRYEIRRPAIQKQFYDIEERVVVRPAGSAVVELDEPVSRTQKGPAVIQPAAVAVPTYGVSVSPNPVIPAEVAAIQGTQIFNTPGIASSPAPAPAPAPVPVPAPVFEQEQSQQSFSDEDSVSIENPDISLRSSLARTSGPSTPAPYPRYERPQPLPSREQFQARSQAQLRLFTAEQTARSGQSYEPRTYDSRASTAPRTFEGPAQAAPVPQSYTTSQTFGSTPYASHIATPQSFVPQARLAESVIPSARDFQGPEVSQVNQQRLIDLLTARGGIAEVGFGRSGASISSVGESGQVRGRVISATPAPAYSEPAGERVNTRRIVVSRPIETLQEVEVAEPVTKFERVQVNQPTLIKTARQDLVRVPASVPVYGKVLAPAAPLAYSAPHNPWE